MSHSVAGVIILLNGELDALHADLQDAGGGRVVLDRHPSVGGNLGKTNEQTNKQNKTTRKRRIPGTRTAENP